jgi:hypothetical protein
VRKAVGLFHMDDASKFVTARHHFLNPLYFTFIRVHSSINLELVVGSVYCSQSPTICVCLRPKIRSFSSGFTYLSSALSAPPITIEAECVRKLAIGSNLDDLLFRQLRVASTNKLQVSSVLSLILRSSRSFYNLNPTSFKT